MSERPRLEGHIRNEGHPTAMPPMRQTRVRPVTYMPPQPVSGSEPDGDDVSAILQHVQVLWKHKWMLVLGAFLGSIGGLIMCLQEVPMYRAITTLEIQNVREPFSSSIIFGDTALATQQQLIMSRTMRERVSAKVRKAPQPFPDVAVPLASLRQWLGLTDPGRSIDWNGAVGIASGNLRIGPAAKDTSILAIQSDSTNPQAAADYSIALAQEYIAHSQESRWESYQDTGEWLNRAQEELKTKVEQSERRLAEFAKAHGLIIMGSQNVTEDRLKQLETALDTAAIERITKQIAYETSLTTPTESLPGVAAYQGKIADLRREMAQLSSTLTPEHYKIQRIQAQIDELEAGKERERSNILGRVKIDYEAAKRREAQLQHDFTVQSQLLSGQADELIQYQMLKREVETNKALYDTTLAKGKEAGLSSALRATNARVVDAAKTPGGPFTPNVPFNVTLGIMGGLFCGGLFSLIRARMDASIQAPGTLGLHLNLRELGVIPSASLTPDTRALVRRSRKGLPSVTGRKTVGGLGHEATHESLELVTWNQKSSVISEAFRSTVTSILFSAEDRERPKVLVVTSPSAHEGKTTVISNLSIALAEINRRVLLIDADMRLPRLHSVFDVPNTFGLSDFLYDNKPVEQYLEEELVQQTEIPNLYVMPAGPARVELARLLYSGRMEDLIARFRFTFDTILIDTAPVLTVPDARILARAADGVVLVLRAHQTHQQSAFAAVRCLEEDGTPVFGTILNDWDPRSSTSGGYFSKYGYYGYYGSYGTGPEKPAFFKRFTK